jgi:lysophospholipase L1-like esterase
MTITLALLGDSIAYGVGAAHPDDALAALLGRGLTALGHRVESRVFAVPGARSADLAPQVRRAVAWGPSVAVVVIGANDLTRLVPAEQAAAALGSAVRSLRGAGAEVVVAPAPDLSVLPHVPPALRELVRLGSRRLRQAQAAAVLAEGGRVADGDVSAAFAADPALFSRDRFHPSSAGYALIAELLTPAVQAAAG